MGIRYSLPLNDFVTLRGGIGGRRRYWCGHHYYPAGPQSLTGAFIRYCLIYPMIGMLALAVGFIAAPIAGGAWLIRRQLRNRERQVRAQRFPVQRPLPQRPAPRPASRPYGFVPAQRPVQPVPYGFVPAQRPVPAPAYAPSRRAVAR